MATATARSTRGLACSTSRSVAGRQLLRRVRGAHDGKGVSRRHPGGLDWRGVDALVDEIAQAMGLSGISKSQVSKLCKEIDERVKAFPRTSARGRVALSVAGCDLPEGARGRTHRLGRRDNRCGCQHRRTARDRRARHRPGSRDLQVIEAPDQMRGLRGVKLVISDAHELKPPSSGSSAGHGNAVVHFMRTAKACRQRRRETVVAAAIRQAFIQPDRETAGQVRRHRRSAADPGSRNSAG